MCRYQCRLEHHVPQGTATPGDGPFSAKGSAVVRDRLRQSGECRSLFAGDGADLGHFCDQHRAGDGADPRDGTKDDGGLRQAIITGDGPGDPVFQFLDQAVDPLLQLGVDVLKHNGGAELLMCARICASSRLRISTNCALLVVKALRRRSASGGIRHADRQNHDRWRARDPCRAREDGRMHPFAPAVYAFCNRRRDRIKLLSFHRSGFVLVLKRLGGEDRFGWPRRGDAIVTLSAEQLHWLLDGIAIEAMVRHPVRRFQHAG
jgi:transposase